MNPIGKTRRIGPLLENNRTAIRIAQFPPANTRHGAVRSCSGIHRLIGDQRLMTAKIPIGEPKQWPLAIAQMID
ncbi:MAG: hypothetical protein DME59_11040 [Verrucomicrobia bacterium]|nr:MAG: hypothetical protein DME59_11040 [Verrucomicrobiota bacterium]